MRGRVDVSTPACYPAPAARSCLTRRAESVKPLDGASLVRAHGAYVWRTLSLLGVRPADVDDVTQEVLITAVQRQHTRRGPAPLRSWIRGICVKKAAGYRRRAHVRKEVSSASLPEPAAPRHPDDVLERSRQLQRLFAALELLEEAPRAVFVLYEIEGLSMRKVAEALGCPLQTAYSRHRVARERIVAEMRRHSLHARLPRQQPKQRGVV